MVLAGKCARLQQALLITRRQGHRPLRSRAVGVLGAFLTGFVGTRSNSRHCRAPKLANRFKMERASD